MGAPVTCPISFLGRVGTERVGNAPVLLLGGVLIDQCGSGGAVTYAGHQVGKARWRGAPAPGWPKIVGGSRSVGGCASNPTRHPPGRAEQTAARRATVRRASRSADVAPGGGQLHRVRVDGGRDGRACDGRRWGWIVVTMVSLC